MWGGNRWSSRFLSRIRHHPMSLLRYILATVLFLLACALAVISFTREESGRTVLVASRDLSLGATLQSDDVQRVRIPEQWLPDGVLSDLSSIKGKRLIGQARAGEALTDSRVADHHPSAPGTVVVPLRLADSGITDLLYPGTRVDVVSAGTKGSGDVLANKVTVVGVEKSPDTDEAESLSNTTEPLVLLSAPNDIASRLAAVSLDQPVTVTLR